MRHHFSLLWVSVHIVACASATQPRASEPSAPPGNAASTEGAAPDAHSAPPPHERSAPSESPGAEPPVPPSVTSVWLDLYNNCSVAMDYCVDDGNALYTSLSSNATVTHSVRPGAKIRYRKGNNCTDTVFTATDESEKQKANLCK